MELMILVVSASMKDILELKYFKALRLKAEDINLPGTNTAANNDVLKLVSCYCWQS